MLDHVGLQVDDVEQTAAFYAATFAPLGITEIVRFPEQNSFVVGFGGGSGGQPQLWFSPADGDPEPESADGDGGGRHSRHRERGRVGGEREAHIALTASSRAAVDEVYSIALSAGVAVLNAPREWPEYHPGYYAVFLRDPDGNNVEAVCHHQE